MSDYRNPQARKVESPCKLPTLLGLDKAVREKIVAELEAMTPLRPPPPGDLLDEKKLVEYAAAYGMHGIMARVRLEVFPDKE